MPSTFEICFTAVGVAFQVSGLWLAAAGVGKVRREYAPDSANIFQETRSRVVALIRRILGRRAVTVFAGTGVGHLEMHGHARAGIPPLPTGSTLQAQIAELDRRTRQLDDVLDRLSMRVEDEARNRTRRDKEVDARLTQMKETTEREISKLATDGLYEQALGLGLTLVGTLLAAVAIWG